MKLTKYLDVHLRPMVSIVDEDRCSTLATFYYEGLLDFMALRGNTLGEVLEQITSLIKTEYNKIDE